MVGYIIGFFLLLYTTIYFIGKSKRFGTRQWISTIFWTCFSYTFIFEGSTDEGLYIGATSAVLLAISLIMYYTEGNRPLPRTKRETWSFKKDSKQYKEYHQKEREGKQRGDKIPIHIQSRQEVALVKKLLEAERNVTDLLKREKKELKAQIQELEQELNERKNSLPRNRMGYYNHQANKTYNKQREELMKAREKELRQRKKY